MEKLLRLTSNFQKLDEQKIFKSVFDQKKVKDFIIELNTRCQLFKKGIDSKGTFLEKIGGPYSENTILGVPGVFAGKREKGLPFDRITLFDTGEFYKSFEVDVSKTDITILADTLKDGVDLSVRWGNAILGLTEDSQKELIKLVLPLYHAEIRKALCV